MMTSDARKRLAEQTADHQIHYDPAVVALIERERRKAAAEARREAWAPIQMLADDAEDRGDDHVSLADLDKALERAYRIEATR